MGIIKRSDQPKYFLYVMELINTGHFYIGITSDFISRKRNHFSSVDYFLHTFRLNWRRKIKFKHNRSQHQKVHYKFAEIIFKRQKEKYPPEVWALKKHIRIWAYDYVNSLEDAFLLEGFMLALCKGNELCANAQFYSSYERHLKKTNKK